MGGNYLYPLTNHIPSFITIAHIELRILAFLSLANQNNHANEILNKHIDNNNRTHM